VSIDLSENGFYGPIPDNWFNGLDFSLLQELYLSSNQLVKTFPQPVASQILFLDINSNNFYGQLPNINSTTMPQIRIMHLDNNHLSSGFDNIDELPNLSILTLSGNPVKSLSESFFASFPQLYFFRCASCKLTGALPVNLYNKTGLIDFRSNSLTGTLPSRWGDLKLMWIYLSNNQLSGSIPENWSKLKVPAGLRELDVSYNQLSGSYPSWLKDDPTGAFTFDSRCNQFSGNLPGWCKDSGDCVRCSSGDGGDDEHKGYLWFLLLPAFLMCGLMFAVVGFFLYRYRTRAGYEVVQDRL